MLVKEKFHEFIDKIEDEKVLESYLNLVIKLNLQENGKLFSKLTKEQKAELDISYEESFVQSNLISHNEVKKQYAKWL